MTTLKQTLRDDLTTAIKARDQLRSATLRLTLSAVSYEETAGDAHRDLSDDEVRTIITREVKKRRDAADAFTKASRADSAARERAEAEVLTAYLPAQLSDDELAALVAEAVTETGASGRSDMGAVMKAVQPKIAGRAEGARVAAEVKRRLAG
jgi:uncharacterized protein YqeY